MDINCRLPAGGLQWFEPVYKHNYEPSCPDNDIFHTYLKYSVTTSRCISVQQMDLSLTTTKTLEWK